MFTGWRWKGGGELGKKEQHVQSPEEVGGSGPQGVFAEVPRSEPRLGVRRML